MDLVPHGFLAYAMLVQVKPTHFKGFMGFVSNPAALQDKGKFSTGGGPVSGSQTISSNQPALGGGGSRLPGGLGPAF